MSEKRETPDSMEFFDEDQNPADTGKRDSLVYERDASMVHRVIDDEVILVPVRQKVGDLGKIYTLNDTAGFIWGIIDGKRQVKEIVDLMVEEFDVAPETAKKDLVRFVDDLVRAGGLKLKN